MRELLTFWSGRGGGEMTLALMVRSGIMLLNPDCLENKFNRSDRAAFKERILEKRLVLEILPHLLIVLNGLYRK